MPGNNQTLKFGRMLSVLGFISLFLTGVSFAEEGFPKEALSTEMKAQTFKASLKDGFHFNEKAPNSVTLDGKVTKPSRISPREMEFKDLPSSWKTGRAAVYVCDDALTYCVPNSIELASSGQGSVSAAPITQPKKAPGKKNKHGFIEDDFAQAMKVLQSQKGATPLMLIDFGAVWCPGCVRLEDEVFPTKQFKNATRDFVKLKINVDLFESRALMEKYNIKGIPALVVINQDQQEVGRVVDYQTPEFLDGFLKSVQKDPTPLKDLIAANKSADPQSALRIGKRLLGSGYAKESIEFFQKIQPPPPELWTARIGEVSARLEKDPSLKNDYVKVLKEALKSEPATLRSLIWRGDLVEHIENKDEKKKIREEGVKLAETLLADPAQLKKSMSTEDFGEFNGYEPMLVSMYTAFLVQGSGAEEAEVLAAWKKAHEVGRILKISAKTPGPAMRYLIVVTNAKMYKEADELALQLIKRDPGNTDIPRRRMKILMGMEKYNEAVSVGNQILPKVLGRNEFWVAESLAKAYVAAHRKDEARSLIDRYLARDEMKWDHLKDSKETLEKLKEKL